jgi:hypothetical protein
MVEEQAIKLVQMAQVMAAVERRTFPPALESFPPSTQIELQFNLLPALAAVQVVQQMHLGVRTLRMVASVAVLQVVLELMLLTLLEPAVREERNLVAALRVALLDLEETAQQ